MSQSGIIPYLFLATFVVALAYGIMQYLKAKKAKAEGHTSASARQGGTAAAKTASSPTAVEDTGKPPVPPVVPR